MYHFSISIVMCARQPMTQPLLWINLNYILDTVILYTRHLDRLDNMEDHKCHGNSKKKKKKHLPNCTIKRGINTLLYETINK